VGGSSIGTEARVRQRGLDRAGGELDTAADEDFEPLAVHTGRSQAAAIAGCSSSCKLE